MPSEIALRAIARAVRRLSHGRAASSLVFGSGWAKMHSHSVPVVCPVAACDRILHGGGPREERAGAPESGAPAL